MTITMRFKILALHPPASLDTDLFRYDHLRLKKAFHKHAQDLSHPENFAVTHDGSFYVRDKDTFI